MEDYIKTVDAFRLLKSEFSHKYIVLKNSLQNLIDDCMSSKAQPTCGSLFRVSIDLRKAVHIAGKLHDYDKVDLIHRIKNSIDEDLKRGDYQNFLKMKEADEIWNIHTESIHKLKKNPFCNKISKYNSHTKRHVVNPSQIPGILLQDIHAALSYKKFILDDYPNDSRSEQKNNEKVNNKIPKQLIHLQQTISAGLFEKEHLWKKRYFQALTHRNFFNDLISQFMVWLLIDEKHGLIKYIKKIETRDILHNIAYLHMLTIDNQEVNRCQWRTAADIAVEAGKKSAYESETAYDISDSHGNIMYAEADAAYSAAYAAYAYSNADYIYIDHDCNDDSLDDDEDGFDAVYAPAFSAAYAASAINVLHSTAINPGSPINEGKFLYDHYLIMSEKLISSL